MVRYSNLKKKWHFFLAVKQARLKLKSYVACHTAFCKDKPFGRHYGRIGEMKKFNFLSGIKIVHYSAPGFLLYLTRCLKKI